MTQSFRRTLMGRGIDGAKIDVVTNGVDIARFSPRPRDTALERQLGFEGCFVAGYIGTHGMAHALETLLDAAEQLQARPDGQDIRLLLLGDGARKAALQADAARRGLRNVVFVDTVPKDEVARYWSLLDVSVPPAPHRAVHHGDPVQAVRVHGHGHRCCTASRASRPTSCGSTAPARCSSRRTPRNSCRRCCV